MNFLTYCNHSSIDYSRTCTSAAPWDRGSIARNRHSRPRVRRAQVFSHSFFTLSSFLRRPPASPAR